MPLDRVVELVSAAAAGLDAAHELGMVHRDVKPANLLLTSKGTVKVTDFGIARALGEAKLTSTGEVVGTAQYLAPEAALGRRTDAQADVYALAVTAYELLCGRRPFTADSAVSLAMQHNHAAPPSRPPHVPPLVASAVVRGLAKDPAARPRGAPGFAAQLRSAAAASRSAADAPTGTGYLVGPPPISQPQSVSSAPPPMVAAGPWQPSSSYAQSAAGPPGPQPGDAVARGLGWAWIALSVFTAAVCALPFVQLGDQSWSTFALAEPATHAGEPHEVGNSVLGWLIAVPMILVGLLGLPAALGNGRAVWALIAVPGCLWSTFITLGLYATVFPADADTEVSPAAGAFLLPAIGALTLFVIVAAAVKRR